MPIQDVTVTINLAKPAALVGLGRPLILANKVGESTYKEYLDLTSVAADFPDTTAAYKKAAAVFAQVNHPDKVAIATYDATATPAGTAAGILEQYFDNDWNFLLLADAVQADKLAVSNALQAHNFKFLVVKASTAEDRAAFVANDRTIVFYDPIDTEDPDAALVGECGSRVVGSITWKFKTLVGVTPTVMTATDLNACHEDGAIAYVTKAGIPQTSEGITATGEYIDILHGRDWVKVNMESSLQNMLSTNDKVPSNDNGISMVAAVLTTVLTTAANNGIVDIGADNKPAFVVTTVPWDQTSADDQSKRIYSGASFNYTAQGAIHAINVHGTIAA